MCLAQCLRTRFRKRQTANESRFDALEFGKSPEELIFGAYAILTRYPRRGASPYRVLLANSFEGLLPLPGDPLSALSRAQAEAPRTFAGYEGGIALRAT